MQLKKAKNNARIGYFLCVWLCAAVAFFAAPETAHAGGPPVNVIGSDYSICPAYNGFTYKIVTCMRDIIYWAGVQFIIPFVTFASGMAGAFIALATVLAGLMIAAGRIHNLGKDGGILLIKGGFVWLVFNSLATYLNLIFNTMDWLVNVMASATFYSSPFCPVSSMNIWNRIDCMLEYIIGGFFSGGSLFLGITGFIVTCLLSGGFGMMIGIMGFTMLTLLLRGIAQCVYTFIMNLIGLTFMVCVSPIFIPMIMVSATKGYFEKWLRLTLGMIIQPAVLFAYMAMLLLAFDTVVFSSPNSIYAAVTGSGATTGSTPIGAYIYGAGAYGGKDQASWVLNLDPQTLYDPQPGGDPNEPLKPTSTQTGGYGVTPSWQSSTPLDWNNQQVMSQLLSRNNNFALYITVTTVDFEAMAAARGMGLWAFSVQLFAAFFLAVTVAYILYTMLLQVPYLSSSLAGEFLSSASLGSFNPLKKLNVGKLQGNMTGGLAKDLGGKA